MEYFEAKRVNTILGENYFKTDTVHNDEVKAAMGLSIDELLRAFIFSSKNCLKQELKQWRKSKEPMNPSRIFAKKNS